MLKRNLTMLTDFYEFTMANGYLKHGLGQRIGYFDMFFRKVPDDGGYAIMAGVEQLVSYLKDLTFSQKDIEYLRGCGCFCEEFLEYLRTFRFECDVYAIDEGTPIFPGEPIVTVVGPMMQAQFVETMVLLSINFQSLVATKAKRIVNAAQGRPVIEFGSRRAQSYDAAVLGARASYIAGCAGTACAMAELDYGVPAGGTMAHSWIQLFETEKEAFAAYAKTYPDNCVFLVDTYNVLQSGVPNAIAVANEVLAPMGKRPKAIRLDSGDIAYLSKKARVMLDEAGYSDVQIMASNSLDEFLVRDLLLQGAKIDSFGIGERMITSKSEPVFGGVYKLVAVEDPDGNIVPKIKISENVEKITTPHFKQVYRLYDNTYGKAIADVVTLHDEAIDSSQPYTLFHPVHTWKTKVVTDFTARPLLRQIFAKGKCLYRKRSIQEIRAYCQEQMDTLWNEVTRFEYPHIYYVDLSKKLWDIKQTLLDGHRELKK